MSLPRILAFAASFLVPATVAAAPEPVAPPTAAYFGELQEQPAYAAEDLARRTAHQPANEEAFAAEASLNDWKLCVLDSLVRWSSLPEGPGTLVDGAFGRCGDLERQYRSHLTRIALNGRPLMDLQFARAMTRALEEVWRPRLVAAALDQALARQKEPVRAGRN